MVMQKQLIGGKAYGYKQQVKYIDRNSFALWMYIICISNIIMQELSGAPYVAGIITYVSAFIIFLCYYWLLLQNIRKMEDSAKYLKWTRFCRIVGIVAFIVAGCIVLLV